jgi:AraC-like DNA-binding protein
VLDPGLHRSLVDGFEQVLRELQRLAGRAAPRALLKAHELLVDIHDLDAARRAPGPHEQMVASACALLGRRLAERLSMRELAASFHLSYERFRKVFREHVGVAPGDYRIRRRIERACRLLVQDRLSAKEIAYELGYADAYCFSKQFRGVMGVAPAAFRREVR